MLPGLKTLIPKILPLLLLAGGVTAAAADGPAPAAAGEPPAAAAAAPDLGKGALYGKVVDAATGQPVADATVALQDKSGKVVAWTRTGADGQYTLAADTLKVLQLRPSRRRGLLARIAHGVGTVVTAPVKLAGKAVQGAADVVSDVDPVRTARAATVTAVSGNPAPIAGQIAASATNALSNQAERKAREGAVKAVLGERQKAGPKEKRDTLVPGEVFLLVSAPRFQEARGKAGAYWLEPPADAAGSGGSPRVGARAWLETVKLAPVGSDKKSEIENMALMLAEPSLEPALAPAGSTVQIRVKLQAPAGQPLNVRVFAREQKKRRVVELKAQGENVFAGELALDPKTPTGPTSISIVGLRAEPIEVDLKESKADPLLDFAGRLDELDAGKKFEFDPRILACENRLDLSLTILDPKHGTPAAPAAEPTPAPAKP